MHQLFKYGKFLDNIQRTNTDLNDYVVQGDVTIFDVYNQRNVKNGEFKIDTEDLQKVKYHKWRLSHGHILTGSGTGNIRDITHIILDISKEQIKTCVVDHINGNATDNRKCNLRICSQAENTLNKRHMVTNTSGFIGVSYRKEKNCYDPEIRRDEIRCHLGHQKTKKEAVYARYLAEGIVFGEFCNEEEHLKKFLYTRDLPEKDKIRIFNTVKNKLTDKGLWQ